jgi:prolipoprotein diacylglyceryltransferase
MVELFRGDYSYVHLHFGLTPAQWLGVPIFVAGLALALILSRRSSQSK